MDKDGWYGALRTRVAAPGYMRKLVHTGCLFFSFIVVGMCSAQTGPALLDLQLITNTNTQQSAVFFTGASVGSMCGSLSIGYLFGRFNKHVLMSLILLGAAVAVGVIPLCSPYVLMVFMHGVVAFFRAGHVTCGNTDLIRTWEAERRVFIQILHFCFALGGTLSPLITEPFLAYRTDSNNTGGADNSTTPISSVCVNNSDFVNNEECDIVVTETKVQYAYLITGILFLVASLTFLVQRCCHGSQTHVTKTSTNGYENLDKPLPMRYIFATMAFVVMIFIFLVAVETCLASFLLTFVVVQLNWTKTSGARVTSVFWACYAAMRFATIFFTDLVSPFALILVTSITMLMSAVGLLMSSIYDNEIGVWACVALGGLSLASQFPSTMMWLEESILRLSSRIVSIIVFSATLPGIINPLIIGYLMEDVSPLWLMYILTIESGVSVLLILALFTWSKVVLKPVHQRQKSEYLVTED
ncbi:sodium-dependent glucose transporter 1-like isoform X2 [Haliotis rufescens]|uniref:sodium-dependent glucose transporter 1-like isoform X1 n=1 Tax=Haliotis rufescens TaxID=6454 RepID=UPI001EAFF1D0|nr:sodium-dependent glucose transporter 1-like isoform X1 [Haliotis rufescens]XP_048253520.1 sodium-dependent glucose transporter 1-like isoform X2 [Haliotis rufescens]